MPVTVSVRTLPSLREVDHYLKAIPKQVRLRACVVVERAGLETATPTPR